MHQALYREFRPKVFSEVVGQDHIVSALINQVTSGNIGHAYLFVGSRGTGKTSCAKIFSKAINCLQPVAGSPCGKCETCLALDDPSNIDILEIDAASNNGVDEVRALREKIKYPPIHGKFKVYIIDEVHMLTDSAFNALLKTLEEPPSHAVFILATTEVFKLPATILSRCMRFDFKLVATSDLQNILRKVFTTSKITCDEASIEAIALAGEGSVRDALSVADCVVAFGGNNITFDKTITILGSNDRKSVIMLCNKIFEKDLGGVLEMINDIALAGKNLVSLCKEITVNIKDLLVIKNCGDKARKILMVTSDTYEELVKSAEKVQTSDLIEFLKKFSGIESELKYALSPRTLIELTSLECASIGSVKKN